MTILPAQLECPAERVLRLSGRDVADLLQRIAASDLRELPEGASRRILFCDDKGRLVDLPLWRRDADAHWLLAAEDQGERLAAWIERWVISEDVRVERPGRPLWLRVGPSLADESLQQTPDATLPALSFEALRALWLRAGIFRPSAGLAAALHPLELGLRPYVSFRKGCYIGQEVVARMENYEKVRRALAWLRGPLPAPNVGARLEVQHEIGQVLDVLLESESQYLALVQAPLTWRQGAQIGTGLLTWVPETEAPLSPA